ncbi:MAG: 1-(5-phosphoribosyl)-5-[(5-phosphoribosylamino)methylideneamino]imidazole-4-carboxamide isomerase [Bacteroidia bacterium]|nr:1-(5-phosphoribosyl)-5-[(5-phosphoribosylamino)methylideneamino]imidazole-4-carboxamide isomerase [Bacteroidia bacterium]
MIIIPAIDIIDGQCVRLSKGDYGTKKVYDSNPVEVALRFEDAGITHLHVVDLDGAKAGRLINSKVLQSICNSTKLKVDFGGGVRKLETAKEVIALGASQVTGGSIAVREQDHFLEWISELGTEAVILGADAKDRKIAISGWEEGSDQDVIEFIDFYHQRGIKYVISTDISRDGMLTGPSIELYTEIINTFPEINVIASGGIADIDDIYQLRDLGCYGAITGKAIYEGNITMDDLIEYMIKVEF